jgi:hypothetical protein
MAKASKKHIGVGAQGKGDGSGAMAPEVELPENAVLSNRDKSQHPKDRGYDAKWVQVEQGQDTELNQAKD